MGFSQKEIVELQLRGLCEDCKKESSTQAYLIVRMNQILEGTKYRGMLKAVALKEFEQKRLIKYIYDCYLVVCGLMVDRKIKQVGNQFAEPPMTTVTWADMKTIEEKAKAGDYATA